MTARLDKALPARRMGDLWAISAHVDPCVLWGHLRMFTRAVNLASGRRDIMTSNAGRLTPDVTRVSFLETRAACCRNSHSQLGGQPWRSLAHS